MRELTIVWDVGFPGGRGGIVKADHQHTVIALVKNTGKAHNIVGDPRRRRASLGSRAQSMLRPSPCISSMTTSSAPPEKARRGGGL